MIVTINGKTMEEKLKRGWTTSGLAEYFGVSEQGFEQLLEKNFTSKAVKGYKRRLDKNNKRYQAYKKSVEDSNKRFVKKLASQEKDLAQPNTEEVEKVDLELLKELEQSKKDKVLSLEIETKNLETERSRQKNKLYNMKENLERILADIEKQKKAAEEIVKKITDLNNQFNDTKIKLKSEREELRKIQNQIKEAEQIRVPITFDSLGNFSCGNIIVSESEEEIREKVRSLLSEELIQDITVKQLRVVARLSIIQDKLEQLHRNSVILQFSEESEVTVALELLERKVEYIQK